MNPEWMTSGEFGQHPERPPSIFLSQRAKDHIANRAKDADWIQERPYSVYGQLRWDMPNGDTVCGNVYEDEVYLKAAEKLGVLLDISFNSNSRVIYILVPRTGS